MESSRHQRVNYNFGVCSGGGGSALHVGVHKHTVGGFETRGVCMCAWGGFVPVLRRQAYLAAEAAVRGKANGH